MRNIFFFNRDSDKKVKEIFGRNAEGSEGDRYAVMLAVDGVYRNGRYIKDESDFKVPNDYIIKIKNTNRMIIFGASVHPYREHNEMLNETKRCLDAGAAFFVWMPSIQKIEPDDERCIPFYIQLAKMDMPLLCYTGFGNRQDAFYEDTEKYNNPGKLVKALDIGVSVIIANCPSYGSAVSYEEKKLFGKLLEMLILSSEKEWNLYADISPYCRQGMAEFSERIENHVRLGEINPKRLIYGCSFPVPPDDTSDLEEILPLEDIIARKER